MVLTTEEVCCVGSVCQLFKPLVKICHFSISVSSVCSNNIDFRCFVVFRFNITSRTLLGYVLFCQTTIAATTYHYSFIYDYILYHVTSFLRVLIELSLTVSQFWSLKIMKAIIPPFCISEKLTGIHVHMLNFVPVMYPLVLVIISCILMELHARIYRIVGILWKPFNSKTNITAVIGDAVFHAFASFIFLSNISVAFTTYQVVKFVTVWNSTGHFLKQVLYTDPTVEWNTSIPYAHITEVFLIFVLLIPSLLLCIYPTRLYRFCQGFLMRGSDWSLQHLLRSSTDASKMV